jgi:hypothetical protein
MCFRVGINVFTTCSYSVLETKNDSEYKHLHFVNVLQLEEIAAMTDSLLNTKFKK